MVLDAYVRVSKVRKRHGPAFISPVVQRDEIEQWARRNGVVIAHVFEELDESDPLAVAAQGTLRSATPRRSALRALRWRDVDLAGGWLTVGESKTAAGVRRVKIRPVLRDVLTELRAARVDFPKTAEVTQDACVFGTDAGKRQNPSNVRARVVTRTVQRADARLAEAGEAPLPAITPHGLRRSFASLLYGIGEPPPVVMQELGHTDPALALSIYAHAMRRDDGENERLKALVEGADLAGLVTGDHSERSQIEKDVFNLRRT